MIAAPQDPYGIPATRPQSGTFLVDGVRAAVDAWRANEYAGASPTTLRLLRHWFDEEHIVDGRPFQFYFCQRDAVETFIYLNEIDRAAHVGDLLKYSATPMLLNPADLTRQKLAFKMATGSGKTMAMALCMTWSYFHKLYEPASAATTNFLMLAPNIIVYERLREDFGGGHVWRAAPLVPPEYAADLAITVVLQDEQTPVATNGVLYLTNIQRLYDNAKAGHMNAVDAAVGPRVNRDVDAASAENFFARVAQLTDLLVLNDEAHHVWSEKLKWNQTIEALHRQIKSRAGCVGVLGQLDFSATPKDQSGQVFRHVVVDYPLAQAVADGIVKTPLIGEVHGAQVQLGDTAVQRYRQWLDVAVARWRRFDDVLSKAGRSPILFVMCENTQAADEVADYLQRLPDFAGDKLLVIHTNPQGEITKQDLDLARKAAREVDRPGSRVRCIVSVLMLREGWDVKNVTVIVTLRSLSAASKILPEQALGRGLRRMTPPGSGFDERVVVIEHDAFRDLWSKQLDGGLVVEREDADNVQPGAVAIFPDAFKADKDISLPSLSRIVSRSARRLDQLNLEAVGEVQPPIEVPEIAAEDYIKYRGLHLIDKVEVERAEFLVPYVEDALGVVSWYTRTILKSSGMSGVAGAYAALVPLVKRYLTDSVFDRPVDLGDKVILRRLAESDAQAAIVGRFRRAVLALSLVELPAKLAAAPLRLSKTPAFPWSRETVQATRTVFNLVAVDNSLEARFARFLERAAEVDAFAKLTLSTRFALEYLSSAGGVRSYYPDFVARLTSGEHLLIETKGLEDLEVARKDQRAQRWCQDATSLSGSPWTYVKVAQKAFDSYTGDTLDGLRRLLAAQSSGTITS